MKIYLLGASGGVGRLVAEQALKRGHDLTVHARGSSRLSLPERVAVVRRELNTEGAFEKLPGHDAVISCIGIRRVEPKNPFSKLASPANLCQVTAHNLARNMAECGIRRVVAVSAGGVGDSAAGLNLPMKLLLAVSKIGVAYKDLLAMEQTFAGTSLDWFCARPVTLTDGKGTGKIAVVEKYGAKATITRADVAKFLLDRVEEKWPFIAHTQMIANAPV